MTRTELTAQTRFQQSMRVLTQGNSSSPYGLRAVTGYLGKRDAQTGDRTFTDATGVTTPARDLRTGAQPSDHEAAGIQVEGGKNYVR
ncbi:MAG: hypothetical protein KME27_10685 [Lyngbya sp. HA4199-MV5]|jgi:hypothetical protein|nr:hypothetical protein [Lyngbya sp. HA4199-MV5]